MVLSLCDELDKAKDLNDYYNKTLKDHIKHTVVPKISTQTGDALLKEFVRQWNNYTILVHFMRKMFNYLDRYYLKNSSLQSLAMAALCYFRDLCFNDIQEKVKNALIEQITKDRNGEYVDWDLLKRAIAVYVQLGFINAEIVKQDDDYVWKGDKNLSIYEQHFEKPLLHNTEYEYRNKSTGWMSQMNCPEYLREVEKHLKKEEERADYYL